MTEHIDILGYAHTGREFEVMDELTALGVDHWRGERIEFERRGKQRTPEGYPYPALPNYIWVRPTHAQLHLMVSIRHLAPTVRFLSRGGARDFGVFSRAIDAKADEARRIAGNRKAIAQYQIGERLEIREGVLAGEIASFTRLVEHSWMMHPMVEVEYEIMGRTTKMEVDPLSVRKAV